MKGKKKKSQCLHRQSFQLSLFLWLSGCCLLKVTGSAHHSLLRDIVKRSQLCYLIPVHAGVHDLLTVGEKLLCLHPTWKQQLSFILYKTSDFMNDEGFLTDSTVYVRCQDQ